jgi:hypothetical protein
MAATALPVLLILEHDRRSHRFSAQRPARRSREDLIVAVWDRRLDAAARAEGLGLFPEIL